jgi:hypothetical protein
MYLCVCMCVYISMCARQCRPNLHPPPPLALSPNNNNTLFVLQDMEVARGCFRHLRLLFQELEETRPFELLKGQADRVSYLCTKQAKVVAMTCTHASLKRHDFMKLGLAYDNILMEEAGQVGCRQRFQLTMLVMAARIRSSTCKMHNARTTATPTLEYTH